MVSNGRVSSHTSLKNIEHGDRLVDTLLQIYQLVHDFLSQQNNRLFLFLSLFVAGRDQSAADQPNNLAEGHPPL